MTAHGCGEIVLLSAHPLAHDGMVRALRHRGVRVRVPRAAALDRVLDGRADLILVDLVHGAGLTREAVAALNRRRGRSMVVALHEGLPDPPAAESADLVVEGFCHCADWHPLLDALGPPAGARRPLAH